MKKCLNQKVVSWIIYVSVFLIWGTSAVMNFVADNHSACIADISAMLFFLLFVMQRELLLLTEKKLEIAQSRREEAERMTLSVVNHVTNLMSETKEAIRDVRLEFETIKNGMTKGKENNENKD